MAGSLAGGTGPRNLPTEESSVAETLLKVLMAEPEPESEWRLGGPGACRRPLKLPAGSLLHWSPTWQETGR